MAHVTIEIGKEAQSAIDKRIEMLIDKQLISFGNYLLSERRKLTVRGKAACQVNDVDLANWRAEQEKEK